MDFNLPHTTHVDASVRDGVKIELSDGGFVAFNSLGLVFDINFFRHSKCIGYLFSVNLCSVTLNI